MADMNSPRARRFVKWPIAIALYIYKVRFEYIIPTEVRQKAGVVRNYSARPRRHAARRRGRTWLPRLLRDLAPRV
jgi:hypothetical protein